MEAQVMAELQAVEARARCRDMRTRWQQATSEKLFYQKLKRVFVAAVLLFAVATLVLYYVDATRAGAGASFITTIVTGALAAYFERERSGAEKKEADIFADYNEKCPLETRTLLDAE